MLRFEAVIEAGRGGGSFVELPREVVEELGRSRRRVRGTLNGVAYSSSTMPMGEGGVCLGIHKAVREAGRASFGTRVLVEIEPDDAPRELEVPEDLARALATDRKAREAFDSLSFTHRKEYAQWVAGAKKQETRDRRLARTVEMLREGVRHP